jgi:hypothetical protein
MLLSMVDNFGIWKGDYVNIHMHLLFTLSKMYSRLVWILAILACSKHERSLDHLLKMLLLTAYIYWNGNYINAYAPSPITLSKMYDRLVSYLANGQKYL